MSGHPRSAATNTSIELRRQAVYQRIAGQGECFRSRAMGRDNSPCTSAQNRRAVAVGQPHSLVWRLRERRLLSGCTRGRGPVSQAPPLPIRPGPLHVAERTTDRCIKQCHAQSERPRTWEIAFATRKSSPDSRATLPADLASRLLLEISLDGLKHRFDEIGVSSGEAQSIGRYLAALFGKHRLCIARRA